MLLCSEERGQASLEAALVISILFVLLLFLLQPACLLYGKVVMGSAAASACRVLSVDGKADKGALRAFIIRRLRAVPNVAIFHEGGDEAWQIELEQEGALAQVTIKHRVRPLPFIAFLSAALALLDDAGCFQIELEVSEQLRPQWLEGNYEEWQSFWSA